MSRILSIDPSGTGTTGLCFINSRQPSFSSFQNKDWKEHLAFLMQQVKELKPDTLLYEHTNYINLRGKDMTSLFKLFGAIESLIYLGVVSKIGAVPVNQIKALKDKLLKGTKTIAGLEYHQGRGKGWRYHGQRINPHELDAYLVHYLGGQHDY